MLSFYTKDEALNRPVLDAALERTLRRGYDGIADWLRDLIGERGSETPAVVAIDGALGVAWEAVIASLRAALERRGVVVCRALDLRTCLKPAEAIDDMVRACLDFDPTWGRVYDGTLTDFFDPELLEDARRSTGSWRVASANSPRSVIIVYGPGAGLPVLAERYDSVGYIDLTRREMLGRLERREASLLGRAPADVPEKQISRRLSYVELPVLNDHKRSVLHRIGWYIAGDRTGEPLLVPAAAYRAILGTLAVHPFRPLPYYFPRVWGGTYMVKLRGLPMKRCSFCIEVSPSKQSIRIGIGDSVLEVPFLNLLWNSPRELLGEAALQQFGEYFPLTLNYDDTYHGGSLAIQCHPGRETMRGLFNEVDTHDETYYIVKAWKGSKTYHGLRDGCDLGELRALAERAERDHVPFDYEKFINSWDYPGTVHDLYLHPAGTVHASGVNQLVLEIDFDGSRAGQEYTFHLYDYLRKDLDGSLRGIHLEHFFRDLRPERTRSRIPGTLKQEPRAVRTDGRGFREEVIGDSPEMLYKVHRLEFRQRIEDDTRDQFHILSLVQGERIEVRSRAHPERRHEIGYTESIILPAALGPYEVINRGSRPCRVTKALLR